MSEVTYYEGPERSAQKFPPEWASGGAPTADVEQETTLDTCAKVAMQPGGP